MDDYDLRINSMRILESHILLLPIDAVHDQFASRRMRFDDKK